MIQLFFFFILSVYSLTTYTSISNISLHINVHGKYEKSEKIYKEIKHISIEGKFDERETETNIFSNFKMSFPSLQTIRINLEIIPKKMFINSKIENVTIGSAVQIIRENAFAHCRHLRKVTFASNSHLSTIENEAFQNCDKLKEIQLPSSLKNIYFYHVFNGCYRLENITFEKGSKYFTDDGMIFSERGDKLEYCYGNAVRYEYFDLLPTKRNTKDAIQVYKRERKMKKTIFIPPTVTRIENEVIQYTKYETLILPADYYYIMKTAFEYSNSLKKVLFGADSIYAEDGGILEMYKIEELRLKEDFDTYFNMFDDFAVKSTFKGRCGEDSSFLFDQLDGQLYIYGKGIANTYETDSFYDLDRLRNYTKRIDILDGITTISEDMFYKFSSLKSITIPPTVKTIENDAFLDSSINKVKYEGIHFIENCSLTSFRKTSVKYIDVPMDFGASYGRIPRTIGTCGKHCEYIYYHHEKRMLITGTYMDDFETPDDVPWQIQMKKIEKLQLKGIKNVGKNAFNGASSLYNISMTSSVKSIGEYAFYECRSLRTMKLPEYVELQSYSFSKSGLIEVTYLGNNHPPKCSHQTFIDCSNRLKFTLPSSYTSPFFCGKQLKQISGICGETEYDCSWKLQLNGVLILSGNGKMTTNYFNKNEEGMTSAPWKQYRDFIKIIKIGDYLKNIGDYAFYYNERDKKGYNKLMKVEMGKSVKTIGTHAFEYCTQLSSVTVGTNIHTIDDYAFASCTSIEYINIGKEVVHLSSLAFHQCISLRMISVEEDNDYYSTDEIGVLYNKEKTKLIQYPIGKRDNFYEIPKSIVFIEKYAFAGAKYLKDVSYQSDRDELGCYTDMFNSTQVGYMTVPFSYQSSTLCGKKVKSVGICGDTKEDCQYTYYHNRKFLKLIGNGDMTNYSPSSKAPWNVKSHILEKANIVGLTSIGNYAFYNCTQLTAISLGDNVSEVGTKAFDNCPKLKFINPSMYYIYKNGKLKKVKEN